MTEQNISQEFRLKNIEKTRKYFIKDMNQLKSKKHKKVCSALKYIEHYLILASVVTGCILISVFTSLHGIPIGFTSSEIGLKSWAITTGIKMYKPIIKKRRRYMIR